MLIASYNPRSFMTRNGTRFSALVVLALLLSVPAMAQWAEPVAQLAREISAITGPGTVTLTVHNISSLTADYVPVIKRDLQNDLRAAGVRVVTANAAAAEVKLTLSENAQGYVWVAEVHQANETKVGIVTAPRPQAAAPAQIGPLVVIRKSQLWSQDSPILDVALVQAGAEEHMVVLDAANVSLYKMTAGRWTPAEQSAVPHTHAWPRDMRGRLVLARDHFFDAYLPGVVCASTATPPLSLNCRAGDDPWPIAGGQTALFGASHNFFTGVVTPGIGKLSSVPAFYSAAGVPRPTYTLWAFARTDGSVHLMDGVNDVSVRARDWGSDLAAVKSSCGAQTQLLVTATGDGESPDVVRAFEIADREPVEVSAPVEFAGPVTALWTSSDAHSATAVVRNLKTGKYDAFELTINCGQ
ncbi:MAG: hypothetical protein LAN64_04125 [Acidobacteriia bacterium]|nr:hypothetical protein [Terriglobia bacterium]